jgi:1-acyl-sn-glycerol-3-phosphate acyltransferase
VGASLTRGVRVRAWRPRTPRLPDDLARLVKSEGRTWPATRSASPRSLVSGGHVVAYPEGRVGLAADGWPERGRTGMVRLALGMGVPVIPVSPWGAHEVLQYGNDWGKLRTVVRAVVRRPALQVHVGPPVRPDDLRMGRVGDANRARYRIAAAITRGLVPLRADEAGRTAFRDPTRPTTAVAAYPGGVVPDDVP